MDLAFWLGPFFSAVRKKYGNLGLFFPYWSFFFLLTLFASPRDATFQSYITYSSSQIKLNSLREGNGSERRQGKKHYR
jgi:hypothetical protein